MKTILTVGEQREQTTIESGDIIAYDADARSIVIVRKGDVLRIGGNGKLYLPLEGGDHLHSIAKIVSMLTGMGFEPVADMGYKNAFRFSFLIRE